METTILVLCVIAGYLVPAVGTTYLYLKFPLSLRGSLSDNRNEEIMSAAVLGLAWFATLPFWAYVKVLQFVFGNKS